MAYWLAKSEPGTYSIQDLRRDKTTLWDGIRNYQARNYLREMKSGDPVLFYHSNAEPSGIVGIAEIAAAGVPDPTQFDKKSKYYDPKASKENPPWISPKLKFVKAFSEMISIDQLRSNPQLKKLPLLQRGSRLSVHPVTSDEYKAILGMIA